MLSNESFRRKSGKGSGGISLKNVYTEQLNKLQQRHQHECDLLEDLRLFAKQRSVIEKEYAQALCKLAQQFVNKRQLPPSGGSDEHKSMHEVWQIVLEETDRVGKARLQAADTYLFQISEPCKPVRTAKSHVAKKVFENLVDIQKELSLSVQELMKLQKIYKEEEHVTHDACIKAADADDKVKRKSVGLFTSMSKLQQQSTKLNQRREACEVKSTSARNDYLLSLAATNAHLQRYYHSDTPELMKTLDGDVYERMQEYFTLFCQSELSSCGITQEYFMKILSDATKINRPYNLQCFLNENTVFTDIVKFEYQPQDNDSISKVMSEHQSQQTLDAEAKRYASRFVHEERHVTSIQRKLQTLSDQQQAAISGRGSESAADSTAVVDLEIKMEDLRQALRKAQTEKAKAEARLAALSAAGFNIDEYLAVANAEPFTPEEEEAPTPTSTGPPASNTSTSSHHTVSVTKSDSISGKHPRQRDSGRSMSEQEESTPVRSSTGASYSTTTAPNGSTYVNYQDDDECIDDAFETGGGTAPAASHNARLDSSSTGYVSTQAAYTRCIALYSFQGTNNDELDMEENEQLEVVESEGDGWMRVRNSTGRVGIVPETYIQIFDSSDASLPPPPPPPITEVAGDEWGPPDPAAVAVALDQRNSAMYSATDYEVQAALSAPSITADGSVWVRALYDYAATSAEELSFMEGSLIRITRRQIHDGVDDGWWEGEFNGRVGAFPSLVVEELAADNEEVASPDRPGPPAFAPPPPTLLDQVGSVDQSGDPAAPQLAITQPTPSEEDGGGLPATEDLQAAVNGVPEETDMKDKASMITDGEIVSAV